MKDVDGNDFPLTREQHEEKRRRFYEMIERVLTTVKTIISNVRDDHGPATPERLAKSDGEWETRFVEQEGYRKVEVLQMLDGSILDRLMSRKQITGDHYAAGVRFYTDGFAAGFLSSGVMDPGKDVVDGGTAVPAQERQTEAMGEWARAIQRVGKTHSHVLINVVMFEQSLLQYGQTYHRVADPKDAKLAATVSLRNALTELDHHYYGQRQTRSHHSHAQDYRPVIPPEQSGD